eukprot:g8046.t1
MSSSSNSSTEELKAHLASQRKEVESLKEQLESEKLRARVLEAIVKDNGVEASIAMEDAQEKWQRALTQEVRKCAQIEEAHKKLEADMEMLKKK